MTDVAHKTNFQQSARIRRAVENMAYNLLKDCKAPTTEYDGEYYAVEHWKVEESELQEATVYHLLDNGWEFEADSLVDRQINFHCKQFLTSEDFEEMKERVRIKFYEGQQDKAEKERLIKSHQPTLAN